MSTGVASAQARDALDRRLSTVPLEALARPPRGWVRAIRSALGMTAEQLGRRLGVTQARVSQIERSEITGAIRLDTLERVAAAMNCNLVYALVPRESLHQTVQEQALHVAAGELDAVEHSMALENQALDADGKKERLAAYADEIGLSRKIWALP